MLAVALRTTSLRVSRRRLAVAAPAPLATLASPAVASDARTYARQGMTAFEKGDVEESIRLFDAAEEADPRYATRLWQRGLSYYYADRFKDARKETSKYKIMERSGELLAALVLRCTQF